MTGQILLLLIFIFSTLIVCLISFYIFYTKDDKVEKRRLKKLNLSTNHINQEDSQQNKIISTGIEILDNILEINPNFKYEIKKTNLKKENRFDQNKQPISLAATYNLFPEEKVRLDVYYKAIKQFGANNVEIEFPLRVGSKDCYLDVAIFKAGQNHSMTSLDKIIECKRNTIFKNADGGIKTVESIMRDGANQVRSYLAAAVNTSVGIVTNGNSVACYKKIMENQQIAFKPIEANSEGWIL